MNAVKLKILRQLQVYLDGCDKFAFLCNELERLEQQNAYNKIYVRAVAEIRRKIQLGIDNEFTFESWLYKQFGWALSMSGFDYNDPEWVKFRDLANAQAIQCRMAWVDKMIYNLTTQGE